MRHGLSGFVLIALLVGVVSGQGQLEEIERNTEICKGYLEDVGVAFGQGGIEALTETAYTLAVDNPVGPYIWCYKNIAKDVPPGQIVRLLSPYLPPNTTLRDSTTVADPSGFLTAIQEVAQKTMDNCCGAPNYFNFTLPFNQTRSMSGSMYFNGEKEYIGTSEKYPGTPDTYFFCACPLTSVATTPRNNTYAELYLAGSPASSAAPLTSMVSSSIVLSLLLMSAAAVVAV